MSDHATPPAAGDPLPVGVGHPSSGPTVGRRVAVLWHRVRSGEDPLAFGAVVVILAAAAGLVWFWAGAHHGGVPAASAAPAPAAELPSGSAGPRSGRPRVEAGDPPRPGGRGEPGMALDLGSDPTTATTGPALAVHVAGAVAHPGLYHLPAGTRVADAVAEAGGSLPRADIDRLNLAARLVDGQRVFVSRRGEPGPTEPAGAGVGDGSDGGDSSEPAEPIDLNSAGLAALDSLPGIGPATARAILEERARRGGFRSTRDLLRVPGIGQGRFARLKDHVRV